MEHDGLKWYKFTCALLFIIMAFMGFTMHLMMERMDEINKVNAELKASIPSQNYDIVNRNEKAIGLLKFEIDLLKEDIKNEQEKTIGLISDDGYAFTSISDLDIRISKLEKQNN